MTPTIDQIEAALPYVPAGLHCGDLTEPDERREFAEVVHGIVAAAMRPKLPDPDPVLEALLDEEEEIARATRYPPDWLPDDYDPGSVEVQHGDRWEYRNGSAAIVARNAWPPPKPGTHESDLSAQGLIARIAKVDNPYNPDAADCFEKFRVAADWSEQNKGTR